MTIDFVYSLAALDLFGRIAMRAFLLACAAAVVVAGVSAAVLDRVQEPVAEAFATTAVRL
ncbi:MULTISPECIES: hypothetical protein [unclassified Bradyrhizobium]|uniref:hypothetical protein n=1 Tax=unclassified Bradyrhizobium TaxID=2631580 RepID=UPI0030CF64DB